MRVTAGYAGHSAEGHSHAALAEDTFAHEHPGGGHSGMTPLGLQTNGSANSEGIFPAARSPRSMSSSVVAEPTDASSIPDNASVDGASVRSVGHRLSASTPVTPTFHNSSTNSFAWPSKISTKQ